MEYITNEIKVNDHFKIKLADNGKEANAYCSLNIAPCISNNGDYDAVIYVETNGNPIFIASVALGTYFEIFDSADHEEWWDKEMLDFDIDDFEIDIDVLLTNAGLLI